MVCGDGDGDDSDDVKQQKDYQKGLVMTTEEKLDSVLASTVRVETVVEDIRVDLAEAHARMTAIEYWRIGNGNRGVDRKIDRLEVAQARQMRGAHVILSCIVTLFGSLILSWLLSIFNIL